MNSRTQSMINFMNLTDEQHEQLQEQAEKQARKVSMIRFIQQSEIEEMQNDTEAKEFSF
ncbi:TPA: hypothetical protein JF854_001494 [Enterobacter hormaechei subsp. steigerwaltii]|uniref:hypothetical protein n=1 Tax=Enterobacter cloacae complex TaxID=354276 RepID=UPI0007989AD7|nr:MULTISPECIES: hypothetical protein [Enterobacter cloacae complex]HAS0712555.1 hypothetical protein [Enterobacter hormaechei subsp. steigerwaltii]SAH98730.1 Uncharacterised protein [Enterobacter cloacae]HAS0890271.1 hypothetical protein [Enterobacter hormaechei subsp. steigerwaltii]HAS0898934.1 hypothetical protein [Enterobacter hormaechei subsp. steigerwaltii]HAT7679697.1 hypothetical protein [Enterobacter hormaechei subsp. steigerwaltii]